MATKPKAAPAAKARKDAAAAKAQKATSSPAAKAAPAATSATKTTAPAKTKATAASVASKKTTSTATQSVGNKLGTVASKLKGKGKLGIIGGLLTAGAAAGYSAYNRNKSTSSPDKKSTASSKSDFNKGKDPVQQYGVKQTSTSPSTVLKKSATSTPNSPAPSKTTISSSKKTVGGSKSSSNRITKPTSLSRSNPVYTNAKDLSVKTEGLKRTNPVGKTAEVKNVSLPSLSSTASKSSAAPLSQRAKLKGLRKEKRSERKATRMARRENRIVNKTAKLKSKR